LNGVSCGFTLRSREAGVSGWKWVYLGLLGLSLYVAFGGALPDNSVSKDVSHFITHVALW
jgi:hypothetical protein